MSEHPAWFRVPDGWEIIQPWGDGYALRQKQGGLRVIVDCEEKSDGFPWLHVSVSRRSWTPTHEDMAIVKLAFIGAEKYAYAVWPPTDKYVNIHPHCLHLWARLDLTDGRVLPEFSEILPEVGRSI
jgi:hypothetical protein